MTDIDALKRTRWAFRIVFRRTILPTMFMIGCTLALITMQAAFAAPNPP